MAKKIEGLAPELEAKVIEAVGNGDVKAVRALLETGFDLDAPLKGNQGRPALALANDRGVKAYEVAIELLKAGADWRKGNLNLVWAVYFKDEWATKLLIDGGADVNFKSRRMGPPLVMAAGDAGLNRISQMLIDAGADVNTGALESAANGNNVEMVSVLIKAGAKVPAEGSSLLAMAAFKGFVEIAKALIEGGADVNERATFGQWKNADGSITDEAKELRGAQYLTPYSHVTPLIVAAARGHAEIVEALIGAGADLYLGDAKGETAVEWARRERHEEIVSVLEAAMKKNPRVADAGMELLLAAEKGELNRVKELIAAKANVDARDTRPLMGGLTPLMQAARGGHAEVVKVLLDAGADIGAIDNLEQEPPAGFSFIANEGGIEHAITAGYQLHRSALHWAVAKAQAEVAKVLIDRGAEVDGVDRMKMSPMMLAAEVGSAEIVSDLLTHGADVNLRGHKKKSALMIAARGGHLEIVRLLLAAGAQVDLKDAEAETAMIAAAKDARSEVIEALLTAGANVHLASKRGEDPLNAVTGPALYDKRFKKDVGFYLEFRRPKEEILKSVKVLIDAGADPNVKYEHAFTAMQQAERGMKDDPFYGEVLELVKTAQPKAHVAAVKIKEVKIKEAKVKEAKPKVAKKKVVKEKVPGERVVSPDFGKAAGKEFLAALADLEKLAGSKRQMLDGVEGGFTIHVQSGKADGFDFVAVQKELMGRGCFIFQIDSETATRLGVLPTKDRYDAILAMRTNGANEDLMPKDVVAFLKKLEKDQPFVLTTAGFDFCGGKFVGKIGKPKQLIKQFVKFCSDVYGEFDEETGVEELERTGRFFFWWD